MVFPRADENTTTKTFPANISCFPRRLQRNTFRLPRPLEDVFKTYLQYVFLKRLQDVFARRLAIMSSRRLQDVLEDKKMLHSRRLQYVFTKTNVCWVTTEAFTVLREDEMC